MRNVFAFNKALRIGISRTGIALLQTAGWLRPQCVLLSESVLTKDEAASPDRLAVRLDAMIADAKCAGLPATIILADEWVRLFMTTPPQNATRLQDCRAAADMRFHALYGETAADWQLEADWYARSPFLCCAIPKTLPVVLQRMATGHRLTLIEIVPQFIAAWNRWHSVIQSNTWFGSAQANMLTLGILDGQRLCALRSAPASAGNWHDQHVLSEHIAREALRLQRPAPSRIQLCGDFADDCATWTAGSVTYERFDAAPRVLKTLPLSAGVTLARTGMRP